MTGFARRRAERGETLLELLVTVGIMGVAFVGIVAGIGTAFSATDSHRQESTAEGALRSYAERIEDPTGAPYVNCATTSSYASPAGFGVPATGWTAAVTSVLFWQGDTPPTFTTTCPSTDAGLQQLTVSVRSPAGVHQVTLTVVIVKRQP